MFKTETKIRVRYAETDRMGYAYYGNYATYFEVARVELLRELGTTYKELEDSGVLLPVADLQIKYHRPALYDDELRIETRIENRPTARILFQYEIFNQEDQLLSTAETTLVFVDNETRRPRRAPESFEQAIDKYFNL